MELCLPVIDSQLKSKDLISPQPKNKERSLCCQFKFLSQFVHKNTDIVMFKCSKVDGKLNSTHRVVKLKNNDDLVKF